MPQPRVDFHLMVPTDLFALLTAEAREQDRSINAEIIQALKAWLRGKQPTTNPPV